MPQDVPGTTSKEVLSCRHFLPCCERRRGSCSWCARASRLLQSALPSAFSPESQVSQRVRVSVLVCVRACVRACARACVCACVRACVRVKEERKVEEGGRVDVSENENPESRRETAPRE